MRQNFFVMQHYHTNYRTCPPLTTLLIKEEVEVKVLNLESALKHHRFLASLVVPMATHVNNSLWKLAAPLQKQDTLPVKGNKTVAAPHGLVQVV